MIGASGSGRRSPMRACRAFRSPPSSSRPTRCCCRAGPRRSTPLFERARKADGAGGSLSGWRPDWGCWQNTRWPIGCCRRSAMSCWSAPNAAIRRPLLAALGLALLIYSPNFWWNWSNGFVSYLHTRDNAALSGPLFHPDAFIEFFGSQFAVFGPLLLRRPDPAVGEPARVSPSRGRACWPPLRCRHW